MRKSEGGLESKNDVDKEGGLLEKDVRATLDTQ